MESKRPVGDDTIFDLASTSKSFTAAAVALVIEDDKKNPQHAGEPRGFTTPVSKFLPKDFVLADEHATQDVTVEDILSHRSGMPRHDDSYLGAAAKEQDTPRSVTRNLRNLPLTRPLRTTYQYCNMLYTVATHLVSEVSGSSFAAFLQSRIWDPLGMTNTYLDVPGSIKYNELKPRMATGYYWAEKEECFKAIPFYDQSEAIGAGSIFSSVSDIAKYVRCMLKKSAPLSEESHEELVKPRIIAEPEKVPKHGRSHVLYALGWETLHYRGERLIGHDGCVFGFNSTIKFVPDMDCGIVIINNGDEGGSQINDIIESTLLDDLFDVPAEKRLDWTKVIREEYEQDKAETKKAEAKVDESDDEDEADTGTDLPLAAYVGSYYNKGYHILQLCLAEDLLMVDCTDRSFPFMLDLRRKKGNRFTCKLRNTVDGAATPIKVRFVLGEKSGQPRRLGIDFEESMEGDLIWFDRCD